MLQSNVVIWMIVIYGILGLISGYAILYITDKLVQKKCSLKEITEPANILQKKYAKWIICIINGLVWALAGWQTNNILLSIFTVVLFSLALMIIVIDLRIRIIPNELILVMSAVGALFQLTQYGWKALLIAILTMVVLMAFFLITMAVMGKGKVGAGDIKLAGVMGLVLGYPLILTGIIVMAIATLAYCMIGFKMCWLNKNSMIAYGPFMMVGLIATLVTVILNTSFLG